MKSLAYCFLLLTMISCIPSAERKKKSENNGKTTKLGEISASGATAEEIYFCINNKTIDTNEVPYGCTLGLRLKGIAGFRAKNGKVYCDASVKVLDSLNNEVLNLKDVLARNYPDGMEEKVFTDIIELFVYLQTPVQMNKKYSMQFTLKDKESNVSIQVSETFVTRPTKGLLYLEKGLTSDGFFLYRNNTKTGAMSENVIFHGDTLIGYFTGMQGFVEKEGKVWIDGSVKYYNTKGELLGQFNDLFRKENETGMSVEEVKKYMTATFISNPMIYGKNEDFYIVIQFKDKNSDAALIVKYYFTGESR